MPLNQAKLIEETPRGEPRRRSSPPKRTDRHGADRRGERHRLRPGADVEDVLGDEWDFGVSAMTTDAIRILIAGE